MSEAHGADTVAEFSSISVVLQLSIDEPGPCNVCNVRSLYGINVGVRIVRGFAHQKSNLVKRCNTAAPLRCYLGVVSFTAVQQSLVSAATQEHMMCIVQLEAKDFTGRQADEL